MRVCGNYAEIRFLAGQHITPRQAVDSVDWGELIDFTLFKTIPLFGSPSIPWDFFFRKNIVSYLQRCFPWHLEY